MGTVPLPICLPGVQRNPLALAFSPYVCRAQGALRDWGTTGGLSTQVSLGTQLLLSLQVIHTYLEQTGNTYRCPVLQHVWKVNREGEVRESPSNPLPYHYLTLKEMPLAYVPAH